MNFYISSLQYAKDNNCNYAYDQEGRLIQDLQEQIASIEWRVDGKVKRINRIANSTKQNLSFDYDAMGHRIAKHVYTSANVLEKSTYYVLDATGNIMATYERAVDENTLQISYAQTEKFIYGSSRLGVQNCNIALLGSQNNSYTQTTVAHRIGKKGYDLSNHLGNVLSVISDKVIPHPSVPVVTGSGSGATVDYWLADIIQSTDYYPFGVQLNNRTLSKSGVTDFVRFGFNSHENDDEIAGKGNHLSWGNFGMEPRLGKRWNIDPQWQRLPGQSPYSVNNNSPIFLHDPDGKFAVPPALVAGALGAVSEVISQLAINYFDKGYDMSTSFSKLDYSDIAVAASSAAFWGFFDGGIKTFTSFIGRTSNRKIIKLASKYIIETVIGTVENLAKYIFNDQPIDIGAAIGGALVEAGLGELLPSPKHFERKANNAKRTMDKTRDKMNRENFSKLSTKKQNKIRNKHDKASAVYKNNKIMQRTAESIEDGTAKALGNKAQEYIKIKNEGITIEFNRKTGEQKAY